MKKLMCFVWIAFAGVSFVPSVMAQSQREMNEEAAAYYQEADKKLNAAYKAVMASYGADEGKKEALREAQRSWLKFTEQHLKTVFYIPKGENPRSYFGSMHAMNYAYEKGDLYYQRAVQLNKMIGIFEEEGCSG
ncbi:lysozyme inhibitor LprI family protein [Rubritalea tangerina]|uniref:Lysozyme inhibitor LprI family protein n=2 Tax=Rubritalea tangerina TaxID=430798 RepID=A0ABW4ZDJ8_9BACT